MLLATTLRGEIFRWRCWARYLTAPIIGSSPVRPTAFCVFHLFGLREILRRGGAGFLDGFRLAQKRATSK
jgi:hypothetical protein